MRNFFSGSGRLAKFTLRKSRIEIIVWLAAIAGLTIGVGAAYLGLFATPEELASMAAILDNPAMVALMGPIMGELTAETLFASNMLVFTGIFVALMNIFFVVRNTRTEEEKGRVEVMRSLPTGRLSNLSGTLIVAVGLNLTLSVLVGLGLAAVGYTFGGAMLYGFALGVIGLVFMGLTAVLCQICANSKSAIGISIALLSFFYMLRAVGDIGTEALSYISPLGSRHVLQFSQATLFGPHRF